MKDQDYTHKMQDLTIPKDEEEEQRWAEGRKWINKLIDQSNKAWYVTVYSGQNNIITRFIVKGVATDKEAILKAINWLNKHTTGYMPGVHFIFAVEITIPDEGIVYLG